MKRRAELTTTTVSSGPAGVSTMSTLSCTPRARLTFVTRAGAKPVSRAVRFHLVEGSDASRALPEVVSYGFDRQPTGAASNDEDTRDDTAQSVADDPFDSGVLFLGALRR